MTTLRTASRLISGSASIVLAASVIADTAPIYQSFEDTLTTMQLTSASAGQDVLPLVLLRAGSIGGTTQMLSGPPDDCYCGESTSPVEGCDRHLRMAFPGGPAAIDIVDAPARRIAGIDLALGGPHVRDVDMALPAPGFRWSVGRSYNGRQEVSSSHHDSNGYQGRNWMQTSQLEIVFLDGATDDEDLVFLVLAADRYMEFKRVDETSDEFVSVNGVPGVMQFAEGATDEPDTYTYTNRTGIQAVFFGFDGDASPAEGQLWMITDPAGNAAYIGDGTTGSDAIANGYDASGRIEYAYDTAGRRYEYAYSSVDGTPRLESVTVAVDDSGWVNTGDKVEYDYYTTATNTYGDSGCLKMVTVTMPLSDSGVNDIRKTYYRYWTGTFDSDTNPGHAYALQYVVAPEGTRRFDWSDSTFDDDFLTASESALKPYAAAYFAYDSAHRVSKTWSNGACGCSGAGNGTFEFTYTTNGSFSGTSGYDTAWKTRTVVKQPDDSYVTQYFDETGQTLHRVLTDGEPGTGTPDTWVTAVTRDSSGRLTQVAAPNAVDSYTHSTGAVTLLTGAGIVRERTLVASGNLTGMAGGGTFQVGSSGSAEDEVTRTYASRGLIIGDATLTVPFISDLEYHASATASSTFESDITFYSGTTTSIDSVVPEVVTFTTPAVSTAKNGSNSAVTSKIYLRKDGLVSFAKSEDDVITYTEYTNGLATKRIQDADTTQTGSGEDFEGITIPTGFSSSGSPLHRVTTMTYDDRGRVDTTTAPDDTVTKTYYSKLADGRLVTLRYPIYEDLATDKFYGPVSYSLRNHAGQTEAQALVVLADNGGDYTEDAITTHIDETDDDPLTSVDNIGSLTRLTVKVYDEAGSTLEESRAYFDVPASGDGTDGTHYDATFYGYNDSGRRWRVKAPTGTISRTVFDGVGRSKETWIGTNDASFDGGESSGTDNMVKVSDVVYDGGNDGGLSLVTMRTAFVEDSTTDRRDTTFAHDARGRTVLQTNPAAPHAFSSHDRLGRLVASGQFSSTASIVVGTDDPTTETANRLALSQTFYDEAGRVWKTQRHKIDAADGSDDDNLQVLKWYDKAGRLIKEDGNALTKTAFDRLGRQTHRFVLAKDNDTAYADADDVTGDIVLEEHQTTYESGHSDDVVMTASISRFHGDYGGGATTGALDTNADSDALKYTAANILGRIQITATWHDSRGRQTDVVRYGTYGGATFDRDGLSVPARSDTALLSEFAYGADGALLSTTDPMDLETRYVSDDAGRQVAVIANYVDGTPSGDTDHYTRYAYTDGLRTKLWVDLDGDGTEDAGDQVTTYTFGTSKGASAGDSKIATGHLLQKVAYPDSTGASDTVTHAYNAQNQAIWTQDQAGNVIETTYDTSGRQTHRRVTTLAGGFDGAVRRQTTGYDNLGRVSTLTQYDNAAVGSGSIVDEVKYTYEAWGNVSTFEQDHDSAIGGSLLYDVDSTWAKAGASDGRNTIRRATMDLPDGTVVTYDYLAISVYDNVASRVSRVKVGATIVARYDYNGAGHVVGTDYPEPDVMQNRFLTTSGEYPDLDRFNRVTSDRWTRDLGTDVGFYDVDIAYDRNSSIVLTEDNVHAGFDVDYTMDGRDRLAQAEEGTWSGSSITSRTRDEQWTLDQLGNWDIHKLDLNGNGAFTDTDELNDDRTHNDVNELTARDIDDSGSDDYTLTYDAVGNLTDDGESYEYVYDAFGRLRKILDTGDQSLIAEYTYNGLGYWIGWHYDVDTDGDVDGDDEWYRFVYDTRWRAVATYRESDSDPKEQFVYHNAGGDGQGGSSYIDRVILRDKDADTDWDAESDGTLEERIYYCQNRHHDVVALIDDAANQVEQVRYSSYGVPFGLPAGDADSDGSVTNTDYSIVSGWITTGYDVRGDMDLDGDVDATDLTSVQAASGDSGQRSVLSNVRNRVGVAGYVYASGQGLYRVGPRDLLSPLGRWSERDPQVYVDGQNFYAYARSNPPRFVDPLGTKACDPGPFCEPCPTCDGDALDTWIDDQLSQSNCDVTVRCVEGHPDCGEGVLGTTCTGCVTICARAWWAGCDQFLQTRRHELVHALDTCRGCELGGDPCGGTVTCLDTICSEMRACWISNCRDFGNDWDARRNCATECAKNTVIGGGSGCAQGIGDDAWRLMMAGCWTEKFKPCQSPWPPGEWPVPPPPSWWKLDRR